MVAQDAERVDDLAVLLDGKIGEWEAARQPLGVSKLN